MRGLEFRGAQPPDAMAKVAPASDEPTSDEDSSEPRSAGGRGQGASCMTMHQKILAVSLFLWTSLGLIVFMLRPNHKAEPLSLVKTLYIMAQLITTVGYGDNTPKGAEGMLFLSFYVLMAVLVVSNAISAIAESVMGSEDRLLKSTLGKAGQMLSTDSTPSRRQRCGCSPVCSNFLRAAMTWSLFVVAGTVFFVTYPGEGKSVVEAFYMSIITLTTVGFGDFTPSTPGGRLFSIFWMVFGTAAFADMVGKLSALSMASDTRRKLDKAMLDNIQHDEFFRLCHPEDKQPDGEPPVTRADFVVFMLSQLGKLDSSLVEHLSDTFDSLDRDGSGFLDSTDLHEFARTFHGHMHGHH